MVVAVKALACELPASTGTPLARWQCPDLARAAIEQGIVASISGTTIWRWLSTDAIKPWQHRSWIFPRDPGFADKAPRVLDLYARQFQDAPLRPDEFVISADEKTSVQARIRKHPSTAPAPGQAMRVEAEYTRGGALAYLAAWDVHRAKVFGRCENTTGIDPFDRLVAQVMTTQPYASAHRVFWVVDNGSSHRGHASIERLETRWPTLRLIHLPVHASWLNQIEIYFSVIQRKVVAPNDVHDLAELEIRLLAFQDYYQQIATPFEWRFTASDLNTLLERIAARQRRDHDIPPRRRLHIPAGAERAAYADKAPWLRGVQRPGDRAHRAQRVLQAACLPAAVITETAHRDRYLADAERGQHGKLSRREGRNTDGRFRQLQGDRVAGVFPAGGNPVKARHRGGRFSQR